MDRAIPNFNAPPAPPPLGDSAKSPRQPLGNPRFYLATLPLPNALVQDFYYKIITQRPDLDPLAAEGSLRFLFKAFPRDGSPHEGLDDLPLSFPRLWKEAWKGRYPTPPLSFSYLPDGVPDEWKPLDFLGPLGLTTSGDALPSAEGEGPPAGRFILVPPFLSLSARPRKELGQAVGAIADYLTPPPGAPDVRGLKSLFLLEGEPLLPFAALSYGSGEATVAFSLPRTGALLKVYRDLNGETLIAPREGPLNETLRNPENFSPESFSLICVSRKAFPSAKALANLALWLKVRGRLLFTGLGVGTQTSAVLKAASKAGLLLSHSVEENESVLLCFFKPLPRNFSVWDWRPGDWLLALTADEESLLEEAEKSEGLSPSASASPETSETRDPGATPAPSALLDASPAPD